MHLCYVALIHVKNVRHIVYHKITLYLLVMKKPNHNQKHTLRTVRTVPQHQPSLDCSSFQSITLMTVWRARQDRKIEVRCSRGNGWMDVTEKKKWWGNSNPRRAETWQCVTPPGPSSLWREQESEGKSRQRGDRSFGWVVGRLRCAEGKKTKRSRAKCFNRGPKHIFFAGQVISFHG